MKPLRGVPDPLGETTLVCLAAANEFLASIIIAALTSKHMLAWGRLYCDGLADC